MSGIRKWVRNKANKLRKEPALDGPEERPPAQPFLPTPFFSPSNQPGNYGLFATLPRELRRQILVDAFGGQALHMHLSYSHALVRKTTSASSAPAVSSSGRRRHCGLFSELVPDHSSPKKWQWFGCVCHRRGDYSESEREQRYAAGQVLQTVEPCDDDCLEERSEPVMCICPTAEGGSASCFVGVMGWLLSCQEAYVEGIDVLYGTNTFHISSLDLQLSLPQLVPPDHLARITSLELLWKLNDINQARTVKAKNHAMALWQDPPRPVDSPLHALRASVPETFPHLRRLYVSFQCHLDPPFGRSAVDGDIITEVETIFLGPVEDMVRILHHRAGPKVEINVAIQRGAWRVLLSKYMTLLGTGLRAESADLVMRGRFWKALGPATVGSLGSGESETSSAKGNDSLGYWICGGWDDMKHHHDYWINSSWGSYWNGMGTTF
ncbi:hypothetical protein QBC34DRAFT_386897 [Podospora aff. communis PSN243]|uniref:DUF7730 domain-containing protein n=1 Tax=Podospora aff. communis PSN243 TaxID=3040156 RepID=A0AAV9G5Y6_9PEZI|nr:hypothetical protein QBC34DRAFT_386897 [Podospora aff. communis PSN243]